MNFTNREGGQAQPAQVSGPARTGAMGSPAPAVKHTSKDSGRWKSPTWFRVIWLALLVSILVVASSLVYLLYAGNPNANKFVDEQRLQAVFLANGQVYFGRINSISSKYIELGDIFYLNNTNSGTQDKSATTNLSLVKLGCELHGPTDAMLINQNQVTFWENLRSDGQVAKAVAQYIEDNPSGLKCEATTQSSSTSQDTNNLQNSATKP